MNIAEKIIGVIWLGIWGIVGVFGLIALGNIIVNWKQYLPATDLMSVLAFGFVGLILIGLLLVLGYLLLLLILTFMGINIKSFIDN